MIYLSRKLKKYYNSRGFHIFAVSFLVYVVINLVESYIHFNIGRNQVAGLQFKFSQPSLLDWKKIVSVMFVFAFLQGILTILIEGYWNSL